MTRVFPCDPQTQERNEPYPGNDSSEPGWVLGRSTGLLRSQRLEACSKERPSHESLSPVFSPKHPFLFCPGCSRSLVPCVSLGRLVGFLRNHYCRSDFDCCHFGEHQSLKRPCRPSRYLRLTFAESSFLPPEDVRESSSFTSSRQRTLS